MLKTQAPIGKFITLFYKEGSEFVSSGVLKDKVENLVDLIKIRTKEKGIEYSSTSLQDEMFDVRIELLKLFIQEPGLLNKYESKIIEEISNKYYLQGKHQKLGHLVADTLEVYFRVFSDVKAVLQTGIVDLSTFSDNLPTWQGLKSLQTLQPSEELDVYMFWIESSLNYDYSLIVSDFIFSEELSLKQNSLTDLEILLKKSIEDFGAYSIISNMWQPSNEDETQMMRNIKIKAATIELESGRGRRFSIDDFGKLING